jgi:hypothetical protein
MKDPKDNVTRDMIEKTKNGRGGWRGGGRPKADYKTKMFRADERLGGIIEALKAKLKSGAIDETTIKLLTDSVA